MDADAETRAWLALADLPGLDAARARDIVARCGSAAAFAATPGPGLASLGLNAPAIARLRVGDEARLASGLDWLALPGHRLVVASAPDYPPQLLTLADAPPVLFLRGDPACLAAPQLAIVGSRGPTPAGRETAFDFAARLAGAGLAITSGLAAGIDASAHRGALAAGGRTVAVCGTGLDRCYPPRHAGLANEIASNGAVVSEFAPGTPPLAGNFPRRNRLISGLALGVLVVEARHRSGSLITARLAADQGREVFALPGSIHNPLARGCHRLIKDGARLVESPEEILAGLQPDLFGAVGPDGSQAPAATAISGSPLDRNGKILLNACGFEPVDVDILVERTGFPAAAVTSMLLMLELRGEVESSAGGLYCRLPPRPGG